MSTPGRLGFCLRKDCPDINAANRDIYCGRGIGRGSGFSPVRSHQTFWLAGLYRDELSSTPEPVLLSFQPGCDVHAIFLLRVSLFAASQTSDAPAIRLLRACSSMPWRHP